MKVGSMRFRIGAGYGLIATVVMSIAMLGVYATGANRMPEPIPFALAARLVARVAGMAEVTPTALAIAVPLHLIYGAWWGGLFAASVEPVTWWKGLLLGIGLWIIMGMYLIPFATMFAVAGPSMWIASLLVHAVYGVTYGALLGHAEPHRLDWAARTNTY